MRCCCKRAPSFVRFVTRNALGDRNSEGHAFFWFTGSGGNNSSHRNIDDSMNKAPADIMSVRQTRTSHLQLKVMRALAVDACTFRRKLANIILSGFRLFLSNYQAFPFGNTFVFLHTSFVKRIMCLFYSQTG